MNIVRVQVEMGRLKTVLLLHIDVDREINSSARKKA